MVARKYNVYEINLRTIKLLLQYFSLLKLLSNGVPNLFNLRSIDIKVRKITFINHQRNLLQQCNVNVLFAVQNYKF